jgi:hypothetical protein
LFVSNPTAGGYADLAAKRELHQTLKAMDRQKFDLADELMAKAEALESASEMAGQNIMQVLRRGNIKTVNAGGKTWAELQDGGLSTILDSAKRDGFDGVEFLALRDDAKSFGSGRAATHLAMFEPNNVRSVNAAFDPAKRGSANLLAGGAAAAVGVGAMTRSQQEEQNRRNQ